MADTSKSRTLAAARKKLKEFKQKSQKTSKELSDGKNTYENSGTKDALQNTQTVNFNTADAVVTAESRGNVQSTENSRYTPLHNYFQATNGSDSCMQTLDFFDNVSAGIALDNSVQISNTNDGSEYTKNENGASIDGNVRLSTQAVTHNVNSNTESLRQLSNQISELTDQDVLQESSRSSCSLENRNQELASLLGSEQIKTEQLSAQLREYINKVSDLESQLKLNTQEYENRVGRELGPLQEQLQNHAQTVGILVAEKTELCASLSQSQVAAKQKLSECEELQNRLKASRTRVADLESELATLKGEKVRHSEANSRQNEKYEHLKSAYETLKEQKDEAVQDILELREKLNLGANENLKLQQQLCDANSSLSSANIRIQQLTAGELAHTDVQIEKLTHEKISLEKQAAELQQAVKIANSERDQTCVQYQQYVQQLTAQLESLDNKVTSFTVENEKMVERERSLVKHIGELEKHLQKLQNEHLPVDGKQDASKIEELSSAVESLQLEKSALAENYASLIEQRDAAMHELDAEKKRAEDLESRLAEAPDSVKLQATMESDKVAAARAVAQNMQLKQQLKEMQEAFIRMSNDKLDLTEKLTGEQHINHDLTERIEELETKLHTLATAVEIKDRELTEIRDKSVELDKRVIQQGQLLDRLGHYEAQEHSSHSLQNQLQNALQQLQHLSEENTILKQAEAKLTEKSEDEIVPSTQPDENIAAADGDAVMKKEVAMKYLEEKFTRTMDDIANLTEEKQRLEHLVLQLQGETETIGEYIALYQHQRGVLNQRTMEKEEQLKNLAQDREKLKSKLDQLNGLVQKLLQERGTLTPAQKVHLKEFYAEQNAELGNKNVNSTSDNNENLEHQNNNNTAEKIVALLCDIKNSNLVQSADEFHPCPWCSGQLITV